MIEKMKTKIDLKKYKSWYETEPFEDHAGPFYYQENNKGNISAFECKKHHLNGMGSLHGGMIMSFIDYTLFVISLNQVKEDSFVTVSCSTEFLRASVNDNIIYGKGEITNKTGSMIFIKGEIFNEKVTISTFSGILKRVRAN